MMCARAYRDLILGQRVLRTLLVRGVIRCQRREVGKRLCRVHKLVGRDPVVVLHDRIVDVRRQDLALDGVGEELLEALAERRVLVDLGHARCLCARRRRARRERAARLLWCAGSRSTFHGDVLCARVDRSGDRALDDHARARPARHSGAAPERGSALSRGRPRPDGGHVARACLSAALLRAPLPGRSCCAARKRWWPWTRRWRWPRSTRRRRRRPCARPRWRRWWPRRWRPRRPWWWRRRWRRWSCNQGALHSGGGDAAACPRGRAGARL